MTITLPHRCDGHPDRPAWHRLHGAYLCDECWAVARVTGEAPLPPPLPSTHERTVLDEPRGMPGAPWGTLPLQDP